MALTFQETGTHFRFRAHGRYVRRFKVSHSILIVDDHPLFRDALKHALEGGFEAVTIQEAGSLEEAAKLLDKDQEFDLVLLDLKMPGVQGLTGLAYLRAQYPAMPIAVVTASEENHIARRALDLGAAGFIPKSSDIGAIKEAIAAVLGGQIWAPKDVQTSGPKDVEGDALAKRLASLTPQQVRVLMMLREGLLNKQIAYQLGVSEATIKAHVSAILIKLGVGSRTQAVIAAGRIESQSSQATA
jgi:DNA-binding NarL/FixJ family response regulator